MELQKKEIKKAQKWDRVYHTEPAQGPPGLWTLVLPATSHPREEGDHWTLCASSACSVANMIQEEACAEGSRLSLACTLVFFMKAWMWSCDLSYFLSTHCKFLIAAWTPFPTPLYMKVATIEHPRLSTGETLELSRKRSYDPPQELCISHNGKLTPEGIYKIICYCIRAQSILFNNT